MGWFASLFLRVLHIIYSLVVFIYSYWRNLNQRPPRALGATRSRVPVHLAILLIANEKFDANTTERTFIESIERAVGWCRTVGIEKLTVYDSEGVLVERSQDIHERLTVVESTCEQSSDSEIEYPLTPPLSDYSDSRSISPELDLNTGLGVITLHVGGHIHRQGTLKTRQNVRRRHRPQETRSTLALKPLTLHIVSRESSKKAIASAAESFARTQDPKLGGEQFDLSPEELDSVLEGKRGLSSPDFMIIHPISTTDCIQNPPELHGFPPWQIRLTEIYQNRYQHHGLYPFRRSSDERVAPLDEIEFREALDEYAGAEMRFGK